MEKETISNCRKAIDVYRKLSKDKHYNVRIDAFPKLVHAQAKHIENKRSSLTLKSRTDATQNRVPVTSQNFENFIKNGFVVLQLLLAKQLIRLAFSLASWNDCGGDDELSAKDALKQGEKAVDEAIQIADKVCNRYYTNHAEVQNHP